MNKNNCEVCKNHNDFSIPDDILEAVKKEKLIIFAGAGISTEGKGVFPKSIYAEISNELNKKEMIESFSELMEEYCNLPNGKIKLINRFLERIEYVNAFPEMKNLACKFHRELQTIHQIKEIITTNWDTYFEEICDCIPFVTSKDFALSNIDKRRVYKIHGSISNLGTIVATKSEYDKCYNELHRGLIGNKLKLMLSDPSQQIIFIGYSLTDEDFIRIHDFLKNELDEFMPHFYIITLDSKMSERLESKYFTTIITDATYFLKKLKEKLILDEALLDQQIYDFSREAFEEIYEIHSNITPELLEEYPDLLFSMVYQDGLIHCYQRVLSKKKSGYYSNKQNIDNSIRGYLSLLEKYKKSKNYVDVAYIHGYLNGLISLTIAEQEILPPLYYIFNEDILIYDLDEYEIHRNEFISKNSEIYDFAHKFAKEHPQVLPHHTPIL